MSGITAKNVITYSMLPGIIPRLRRLFVSSFGYIAFLMAQIYAMVRLIPAGHPYLQPQNTGRFGIRDVIAQAANNLVWDKKNIDQFIVFGLLLSVIVLLFMQVLILAASLFFGTAAMAGNEAVGSIFVTANPAHDIALMLLDRVFGVPNFFGSCVSTAADCMDSLGNAVPSGAYPWPFHAALQNFFRYYTTVILLIGTLIFLYYVVVIVAETAVTGTPFGKRFQNVWVPIRLVVAIGMLIPLAYGYNTGQYIAFTAAKYGSAIATNAWLRFNEVLADRLGENYNPLGETQTLIGFPKTPDMSGIVEAMSLAHACAFMDWHKNKAINKQDTDYRMDDTGTFQENNRIKPYITKTVAPWMTDNTNSVEVLEAGSTYNDLRDFFYGGDFVITFGYIKDGKAIGDPDIQPESIEPQCGSVKISIIDKRPADASTGSYIAPGADSYSGAVAVQKYYFNTIRDIWFDGGQNRSYLKFGGRIMLEALNDGDPCWIPEDGIAGIHDCVPPDDEKQISTVGLEWRQNVVDDLTTNATTAIIGYWNEYNLDMQDARMTDNILARGWGGAGIWFNKIAQINGDWMAAVVNTPSIVKYPKIMEEIQDLRVARSHSQTGTEAFNPTVKGKDAASFKSEVEKAMGNEGMAWGTVMYKLITYWRGDTRNFQNRGKQPKAGSIESGMHALFGTSGLYSMVGENMYVHPLSQLALLGRGLVESAIRNIAISTGSSALGGMLSAVGNKTGALASAAGSLFSSISFIALSAGLVLYYVVPFLPFLYFYFAVASWIKTIFEAMVGVPLWALAHLRIDGDGLPGDSAQNGYFLIFEIFLRPILTLFGLLAAMIIFAAQVRILNFIWDVAIENAGGFNWQNAMGGESGNTDFQRNIIDEFFFTVTYAIVVYMMATSSFKLIDTIPDNIMRWAGSNASSFGDINHDPTGDLTRYAALGGMTVGREAAQGVSSLGSGLGGTVGRFARGA